MGDVDDRPIRHVVFNPSARASLVEALKSLGRPDEVVALFDDLRCGPLDLGDLPARERWFDEVLGVDYERGLIGQRHTDFWPKALAPDRRLIAWTTRHGAQDWIGFLFWAARLSEALAEVIDISDVLFPDWRDPTSLRRRPVARIAPYQIVEQRLIELARPVTAKERAEGGTRFRAS
ncbi:DUF1835 domain-containing protein [Chenggangzhangella methanolivorans]|uniref:DUF1835 domain-containing protein n=1 Tax=Chenggangzhangella methanolivorans TaxID=1437009 RepID=A0A9E6RAN8_9HYPH|nr:DUF1835 domain-containing protein [Chenggangzhangella methanolivorans]QZO00880.1 DUF1835 domain-containing protein [Chenggangzhangella methanolivorans]